MNFSCTKDDDAFNNILFLFFTIIVHYFTTYNFIVLHDAKRWVRSLAKDALKHYDYYYY